MPFSSFDLPAQKIYLRHEMKARRALLNESERARASWRACDILGAWLDTRPETIIALFLARPAEICLDALARELMNAGKIVAAPRVEVEAGRMKFWRLHDVQAVQSGPWGVREPISGEAIEPQLVLVPGLAFSECGHRLGTGGGWYDRTVSAISTKVGVGFDHQILGIVPAEAHDIRMDFLATDCGLLRCE